MTKETIEMVTCPSSKVSNQTKTNKNNIRLTNPNATPGLELERASNWSLLSEFE